MLAAAIYPPFKNFQYTSDNRIKVVEQDSG